MGWQSTLSDKGAGLLSAAPAGVTVLTIRPLEKGDAYLVRVQNSTSADVSANIQFPAVQVQEAYLGSVIGRAYRRRELDSAQCDTANGKI